MDWYFVLLIIVGSLLFMMATGLPIAFCFMLVNIVGAILFWGGESGLDQLVCSIQSSLTTFSMLPIPMFVLMGEVMFHSGIGPFMIDALDKLIGRIPGRLSLLAVGAGTLLSTLTGVPMGSIALLGSILVPEMEKRGYKKPMTLGPIMASGGIAILIPPSALAVILGSVGQISVGQILVAIIMPGLLLATLFAVYILLICTFRPSLAPAYDITHVPILEKLTALVRHVLPVGFIIFLCIGVMILGICTPTEAAASGALGCFILAAAYKKLNWETLKKSLGSTLTISVMMFMIVLGAKAFGQNLAYTGVTKGLLAFVPTLTIPPIYVLIIIQLILIILGMFMEAISIITITIPLFLPIINNLGFDPVWFAVLFMLNMEIAGISPPVGMYLFTMKGVAPPDTTMTDIYKAGLPFCAIDVIALGLVMAFPQIALWLPTIAQKS